MKKLLVLIMTLLMIPVALAEEIPQGVQTYVEKELQYYLDGATLWVEDYVEIDTPDGALGFALLRETSGWYNYVFFREQDGQMVYNGANSFLLPSLNLEDHTVRLVKDNALGFTLERCDKQGKVLQSISFAYENGALGVSGWYDLNESTQRAAVENGVVYFYDMNSGALVGQAELAPSVLSMGADFEALPKEASAAKSMEGITRAYAENRYSGWTMRSYSLYNSGQYADAAYSRIENGILTIRRAVLSAGQKDSYYDTISVPLSDEMLKRLETEDFNALICTNGYDKTFLIENAIDRAKINVTGEILQSDLQKDALILLTQENGYRHIWIVDQLDGAYRLRKSMRIAGEVSLDIFHSGEGSIQPMIGDLHMGFNRDADNVWRLSWVQGEDTYTVTRMGIQGNDVDGNELTLYGEMPETDIIDIDLERVPASFEAAKDWVYQANIAVVNNPIKTDRLNLREEPSTSAASLGKFYNGTPVFVLENKGEWVYVQIGYSDIAGWMMRKYLAFGADGNGIDSACEIMEPIGNSVTLYQDFQQKCAVCSIKKQDYNYHIVGVAGNDFYIVLTDDGEAGYAKKSEFWPGNG